MAKLYFRYGAMGSSKTANALMVEYNYRERGKRALLAKPAADIRDGEKIVICYGLRADFQNNLFPGSMWLLAWADEIEEIKTVCWCGRAAKCNARFNENGIVREGAQVVLGGNDSYIALCRKHLREGNLGPDFKLKHG